MKKKQAGGFRTTIGGQALIEGILMRGPEKQAIVVRLADGTLQEKVEGLKFIKDRYPILETLGSELLSFDTGDTKKEDFPVSLEADSEVTNGTIVNIFDVIRESGYAVINLRTATEK